MSYSPRPAPLSPLASILISCAAAAGVLLASVASAQTAVPAPAPSPAAAAKNESWLYAGSDIPRERALDHVAGYCIGLDMTARGKEDRSFRKSIDTYSVLGPWMVTADEIPDPDDVPLSISVNGELNSKLGKR